MEKLRFFLPAEGKQNATFSPDFTQPGKGLLEVPCTYLFWDLGLWSLGDVHDAGLSLDQAPLEAPLGPVDVDALAVLPRHVVQAAPDVRSEVAVFELCRGGVKYVEICCVKSSSAWMFYPA